MCLQTSSKLKQTEISESVNCGVILLFYVLREVESQKDLEVDETNPIDIWAVANLASVIYNQSGLGFAKERNGVNY